MTERQEKPHPDPAGISAHSLTANHPLTLPNSEVPAPENIRNMELHVIPNAHIDIVWQ